MQNSKLIRVLKTFSKKEFKDFEKFAASPYFSRGRDLMPLLRELKKHYPGFHSKKLSKENLLNIIGKKNRKASESLLKLQMSGLYKMAETYLTIEGFKTRPGLSGYFFINQCRRRGLNDIGERRAAHEIQSMNNTGIDRWFYLYYLFTASEKVNLAFGKDNPRSVFPDIKNVSEMVIHQFLCSVARYIYNLMAVRIFHNENTGDNFLLKFFAGIDTGAIYKELEKNDNVICAASRVYLLSALTYINLDSEEHYYKFKEQVLRNIHVFVRPEKFFLLHSLMVKTIYFMDTKDYRKYAEEAFRIINFRLGENLYKESPSSPFTSVEYFVALKTGFMLNETKWMEDYINRHIAEVPPEHRYDTSQLSSAFLKFAQKDYEGSFKITGQTSGLPFVLNYELKCLQLMAEYELGLTSQAFYSLGAFKTYLNKNKNVSEYFRQNNLNFIKYYTLIIKYKLNEIKADLPAVKYEIECSNTGYKNWLLEKIEEQEHVY